MSQFRINVPIQRWMGKEVNILHVGINISVKICLRSSTSHLGINVPMQSGLRGINVFP